MGGSTIAHINLTNLFNEKGQECILYGPHNWHTTKCKGKTFNEIEINPDDIIIAHFMPNITSRLSVRKMVLSLHEKNLFDLKIIPHKQYDKIHFLNQNQKDWHKITNQPNFICPNPHTFLKKKETSPDCVAGIIGSIDRNKNVHTSIERALKDGMKLIRIYGTINDESYYQQKVKPLIEKNLDKIQLMGYISNREIIYNSVSDVYMSSYSENASFVVDECIMTNTRYHLNNNIQVPEKIISNDEVFEIWKRELEI